MDVCDFGSCVQVHVNIDLFVPGIDQVGDELRDVDGLAGGGGAETHVVVVAQTQFFSQLLVPVTIWVRDDDVSNVLTLELCVGCDFYPRREVVPEEVDALVKVCPPFVQNREFHLLDFMLHAVELKYLFGQILVEHFSSFEVQVAA